MMYTCFNGSECFPLSPPPHDVPAVNNMHGSATVITRPTFGHKEWITLSS